MVPTKLHQCTLPTDIPEDTIPASQTSGNFDALAQSKLQDLPTVDTQHPPKLKGSRKVFKLPQSKSYFPPSSNDCDINVDHCKDRSKKRRSLALSPSAFFTKSCSGYSTASGLSHTPRDPPQTLEVRSTFRDDSRIGSAPLPSAQVEDRARPSSMASDLSPPGECYIKPKKKRKNFGKRLSASVSQWGIVDTISSKSENPSSDQADSRSLAALDIASVRPKVKKSRRGVISAQSTLDGKYSSSKKTTPAPISPLPETSSKGAGSLPMSHSRHDKWQRCGALRSNKGIETTVSVDPFYSHYFDFNTKESYSVPGTHHSHPLRYTSALRLGEHWILGLN